jgi:uncharacterized membrane protein YhaH (DUF805 family)
MDDTQVPEQASERRSRLSWTAVSAGIGVLISLTFVYAYLDSQTLRRDAGVFPRFVAILGLVLVLIYLAMLLSRRMRGRSTSSVVPPDKDIDGSGVAKTYVITGLLFLSAWLIGFHLAVPLFVVIYLRVYAGTRYRTLVPTFFGLIMLITIVYGHFMSTPWPRSVLEDRFMERSLQRTLMPFFRPALDLLGL